MMTLADMTDSIKARAREIGFAAVGVAEAGALTEEGARFQEWLGRGYQASMAWMAKDAAKRQDPRLVLPGARSIISTACNYYDPTKHSNEAGAGKISRYAWGDDYHLVIPQRLELLLEHVKALLPGVSARVYVDTGPLMEKSWAVRSGTGWLGKHTNVITTTHGSWVFLGEIILDAELVYDVPIADHCGTCTACLDACPTNAITEPYVVDASKCISYWTIEHRGPIDPSVLPHIEHWIFGCDICQDVCPWNRFARPTDERAFHPRPANVAPGLEECAALTQEEFSERFRKSPVKRTKREGLVRNARAVLESRSAGT